MKQNTFSLNPCSKKSYEMQSDKQCEILRKPSYGMGSQSRGRCIARNLAFSPRAEQESQQNREEPVVLLLKVFVLFAQNG